MKGMFQGVELTVFEYHYETHSYSSKGRRTQHHYVSMLTMGLPKIFPKLMIAPEGIFSKIAQALGFEDIDFESHEFSRSFCVRSGDKKFAYDVCHARLIEYLLQNKDLRIEINRNVMALSFDGRLNIEKIEGDMGRLLKVRAFLPEYLLIKEPV
jgi:hypothetical protein